MRRAGGARSLPDVAELSAVAENGFAFQVTGISVGNSPVVRDSGNAISVAFLRAQFCLVEWAGPGVKALGISLHFWNFKE